MPETDALAFAKEVYAACATVGFRERSVDALKAMIDAIEVERAGIDPRTLSAAAQAVQFAAVAWAQGKAI